MEKSNYYLQEMSQPVTIKTPTKSNHPSSMESSSPYKLRSSPKKEFIPKDDETCDNSENNMMKKKKKKFKYGSRDSLAKRYSPGKEGSRRYNRYLNDLQARTFYRSDTESDFESDIWDDLYDETYEPSYGCFGDLFLNEDTLNSWSPFIDTTEEKQSGLLDDFFDSDDSYDDSSDDEYINMRRVSKKVVKRSKNCSILHHIDSELYNFQEHHDDQKVFLYEDSYRRLLVHSVSEYYNMGSYSKDMENGERITIVRKKISQKCREKPLIDILNRSY